MALIAKVCRFVPLGVVFGGVSGLAFSELNLRALVVVFLRRILLSIMGE